MKPFHYIKQRIMKTIQQKTAGNPKTWLSNFSFGKLIMAVLLISFVFNAKSQGNEQNKEYHHWANTNNAWENGNLNRTNSSYKEGDVVPHVYTPSGLTAGSYSVIIRYDYINTQRNAGGFAAFLSDPTGTTVPKDYYNAAASLSNFAQNVTIDKVDETLDPITSGNTTIRQVKIDFTYTGETGDDAAIYFGLRLATKGEVATYGSSVWPGASLDTRLDPQFGDNTGSRTLTIQTGSINSGCENPPNASISADDPVCDGGTVTITFTGSGGTAPYTFYYYVGNDINSPLSITSDLDGKATKQQTDVGSTSYTLIGVSDAADCSNSASGTVTATVQAISSAPAISTNPITVCQGDESPALADYVTGSKLLWYTTATSDDGNSTPPTVSTATNGSFDYYVSQKEEGKCESERVKITVIVNKAPRCASSPSVADSKAEVGQPITFTAAETQDGTTYSYKWMITNNTAGAYFDGQAAGVTMLVTTTDYVIVKTTTTGSYTVSLVVTNTGTQCASIATNCSNTITVNPSSKYTTYTKGFWGNAGGKFCGSSDASAPLKAMADAFGMQSFKDFGTGLYKFTLQKDAVTKNIGTASKPNYQIYKLLPGGTTPSVLKGNASSNDNTTWPNVPIDKTSGSILNNLLAQGIAMFFNLGYAGNGGLGSTVLYGNKLTFTANNTCASGSTTQTIPICVYNAAKDGDGKVTVQSVYDVAMAVLGGGNKNISAPDANAALNALNVGFDKGAKVTGVTMDNTSCAVVKSVMNPSYVSNETLKVNALTISASPNPFTDRIRFTIQAPNAGRATLEVYNMLGQKVGVPFEGQLNANETRYVDYTAPVNHRSNLIYMLRMNGEQVSGKLMSTKQ